MPSEVDLKFFKTTQALHQWFRKNHEKCAEVWIGFYRKGVDKQAVTYAQALDEALCWGWIDGIKRRIDEVSYTNRFTPRKPRSVWSKVNIDHVSRLTADGRMMPPGIAAFEAREESRTGIYSFEQSQIEFTPELLALFQENKKAWQFWSKQPPGYRKVATHWVVSAKKEETRMRRLGVLIADSAMERRLVETTGKSRKEK